MFSSAMRAFFIACFSVLGLFVGILAVMMVFAGLSTQVDQVAVHPLYSVKILPNAKGKRKVALRDAPVILRLDIVGVLGTDFLDRETVAQQLVESREGFFKGERVKGIILNINSPGGTLVDNDAIFQAIESYKSQYLVPVYAYIDGMALSGGMHVAVAADKIFASKTSLIGSVGVLLPPFLNYSETLDKLGIKSLTITAGEDKDLMNPLRPWKQGEETSLQEITQYYYEDFVNTVVARRPRLTREKLIGELGAGVFTAPFAQEQGFIDEYGYGFRDVLKLMVEELGIDDDNYQVVTFERKYRFLDIFRKQSSLLQGKITHHVQLVPGSNVEKAFCS